MFSVARLKRSLPARLARTDLYDLLAFAAFLTLAVLVLLTFDDYAISNDETVQHRYAELILAYYSSGFTDQRVFHFENLYLYGGLFDIIAVLSERVLRFDLYDIRHVLCAFIGIGGIAATWAVARLVAGTRAGFLALVAIAACGPWYGTMFNHTKDVPFAAAMMAATFFLLRGARDLPRPRWRDILLFGFFTGCALGMRVTGLLLLGYAGLFVLWRLPELKDWNERARFAGTAALRAAPALVLAYLIMIAAWPWAFLEPLNPIRAIFAFAQFHYMIQTLAFGQIYEMWDVPRWYIPAYLAIKLPLTVLTGALIAILATAWTARSQGGLLRDRRQREILALIFIALFPVLCQVIAQGPAFTGMRHFIFVVPPLAALAGVGFDWLLATFEARGRLLGASALAGVAAAFLVNVVTLVELHPYEYLFFNPLISGLEGASRRFDMDYWSGIVPEAVDSLEAYLNQKEGKNPPSRPRYTVGVCAERESFENEAKDDQRLVWVDEWDEADFFISSTQMDCDKRMAGETIATIKRFGVPIGVVKDRRAIVRLELSRKH